MSGNKRGNAGPDGQGELELVLYQTTDCRSEFTLDLSNETVWATQAQIADAFGISPNTVGEHLGNIFREGELDPELTTRKFRGVSRNGREINLLHYSLDAILSVGYRVSSKRATAFRQWATQTLKSYVIQGFALDEGRLRNDPNALKELAGKVRELRSDEKNIYQNVRDVFTFASSNYDKDSPLVRSFYTKLQDKFLFAVARKTASELKLDRADHRKPSMGLTSMKGNFLDRSDVNIGKNYLALDELYTLHILCEQFLLFIESKAIRGQVLTMQDLSTKFDELLEFKGHVVFKTYTDYLAQRATTHAQTEFELWRQRVRALPADQKGVA
jgi:hypothetical protein